MVLGLLVLLAAALCYNFGVVLQALEARRADPALALSPRLLLHLARAPRWLAGVGLGLAGWGLQTWSLTMLPISVVQPGLVLGFAFLFAFARLLLGERAGRRELAGVVLLGAGVALVAIVAPAPGPPTPDARAWALALVPLAVLVAVPYGARVAGRPAGWVAPAASAGGAFAITALTTAVVARSLAEGRPVPALLASAATAVASTIGLVSENSALREGRVTAVLPVMTVLDTLPPVMVAPLLFGEPWPSGALPAGAMLTGLALAVAGMLALAASPRLAALQAPGGGSPGG